MTSSELQRRPPWDALSAYVLIAAAGVAMFASSAMLGAPFTAAMGAWLIVAVGLAATRRATSRATGAQQHSIAGDLGIDGWAAPAILAAGFVALAVGLLAR